MLLDEVGLELELFLKDKHNNILEPLQYGFPSDCMGFLIEIRSHHSNTGNSVVESIRKNIEWNIKKAKKLGLRIDLVDRIQVNSDWINYITEKYQHSLFPDQTRNIYEDKNKPNVSHHTGIMDGWAMAGMHVHFSSRKINEAIGYSAPKVELLRLPIEEIVKSMDEEFMPIIKESHRLQGEYELKSHGFEYRSLPSTAFPEQVVQVALDILQDIRK